MAKVGGKGSDGPLREGGLEKIKKRANALCGTSADLRHTHSRYVNRTGGGGNTSVKQKKKASRPRQLTGRNLLKPDGRRGGSGLEDGTKLRETMGVEMACEVGDAENIWGDSNPEKAKHEGDAYDIPYSLWDSRRVLANPWVMKHRASSADTRRQKGGSLKMRCLGGGDGSPSVPGRTDADVHLPAKMAGGYGL